jgi:hypothetical protein
LLVRYNYQGCAPPGALMVVSHQQMWFMMLLINTYSYCQVLYIFVVVDLMKVLPAGTSCDTVIMMKYVFTLLEP